MYPRLLEVIGWTGSAVFLGSLYLVSAGWIDGTGLEFNTLLLIQSLIFIFYSIAKDAKPYVFVEIIAAIIAIAALWKAW